ncbi:multidrug effflux MFS transporter [Odoribacter sp. OttesenSCG-928-J03]|nr:multidrug effflux MFS transporter [Odoribacter sp. OttesenSCG-928-J03]MDL2282982.1 multidrug effflux MFS transporter [Odoribacter sp. OttesenSCG-928-G04]MDL2331359.1 multidrug effflux MFS transporter [Odoribacter sp. OttesenSCG-928-A06]
MKNFTLFQWMIIIILSLLTALEPLSIDLYLPGFLMITEAFSTTPAAVQLSLSTFLGGFAVGQLFWGPIADRFGRKKPILISLLIFIVASIACIYVRTIEQLWVVRFIQALGGCGGIVISRAVVTDYFDKSKTLRIFTLLALIMSVAPIVAPLIGTTILKFSAWKGLFGAMALLGGIMFLLTAFFLPETHRYKKTSGKGNVFTGYWEILLVRQFTVYAIVAGIANGALMLYVGSAPFIIMEFGGLSADTFSTVFSINAAGLMVSSYLTGYLQKYMSTEKLVQVAMLAMFVISIVLLSVIYFEMSIYVILGVLFFYIFPIGILFPATTELAITPFTYNSGSASALFGSIQLLVAFICTIISNLITDGSVFFVGVTFFICAVLFLGVFFYLILTQKRERQI